MTPKHKKTGVEGASGKPVLSPSILTLVRDSGLQLPPLSQRYALDVPDIFQQQHPVLAGRAVGERRVPAEGCQT